MKPINQLLNFGLAAIALGSVSVLAGCSPDAGGKTAGDANAKGGEAKTENKAPDAAATAGRPATTGAGVKVDGDTIKIGLVAALNGDQKPWGEDSQVGVMLVEDEINKAGGIQGKKVKFIVQDSNSNAEGAKSAAEKLVGEGVVAILGDVASSNTAQIIEVAKAKGVPVISVGSTRTDLADKSNVFFRVCYTDDFQGPVMAKFAYDGLKLKKVALMTDAKQVYSTGLSESFRKAYTSLGGEIVDEQKYETGQASFQGIVDQVKAKNPDGLFLSGYFTEVGAIAKAVRGAGMSGVKLLGGDGWDSPSLITNGGEAILGGYFCNHYSNFDDRPEVKAFLEKWKAKKGTLPGTTMGALGYDAAMLAVDSLKRSKELSSAAMITALDETVDFAGVSGKITLKDQKGNPKKDALIVVVAKEGFKAAKSYAPSEIPTL